MDIVLAYLKAIADKVGASVAESTTPDPAHWLKPSGDPPTVPLTDLDNEGEILRYAVWGFKPDMTRGVAPTDFGSMLTIAEGILRATSPQQADVAIMRAGFFPPVVAALAVLLGATQGFSSFLTPTITAPASIQTVKDMALYAMFKPVVGGPGPSG